MRDSSREDDKAQARTSSRLQPVVLVFLVLLAVLLIAWCVGGSGSRARSLLSRFSLGGYSESAGQMQEFERTVTGTLTSDEPDVVEFTVDGGMQVFVSLDAVVGPNAEPEEARVSAFVLEIETPLDSLGSETWTEIARASTYSGYVNGRLPQVFYHTTNGSRDSVAYRMTVGPKRFADSLLYSLRILAVARGDAGTQADAGRIPNDALELTPGETIVGHLFGAPEKFGEDYVDYYRVRVPASQEIVVTIDSISHVLCPPQMAEGCSIPDYDANTSYGDIWTELSAFHLGLALPNALDRIAVQEVDEGYSRLHIDDFPQVRRDVNERGEQTDYYVYLRHNVGNIRYWLRAEIKETGQ